MSLDTVIWYVVTGNAMNRRDSSFIKIYYALNLN